MRLAGILAEASVVFILAVVVSFMLKVFAIVLDRLTADAGLYISLKGAYTVAFILLTALIGLLILVVIFRYIPGIIREGEPV